MSELWARLPPGAQDALLFVLLLAPGLAIGLVVLRGLSPFRLVGAMLRRFAAVNALFVLLIAVSVGLGVGLIAQERGLRQGSARAAEKFGLVVAAPGSEITAMLAAVYLQPADMALLTGAQYAEIAAAEGVAFAAPIGFGDSFEGAPVVGTTADFVRHLAGDLAEGRMFETEAEAVVGARVAIGLGEGFAPAHGHGAAAEPEAHGREHVYAVVGRMPPTGAPWDRAIIVPIEGVWEIHGLANGHADPEAPIGPPFDAAFVPGAPAVLVQADDLWGHYALRSRFIRPDMMAFFPGAVLSGLHGLLGDVRQAMSALATLTQALVTLSILTGLVILMRLVARSLALLRAIGAPVRFVFAVVWCYSAALIVSGAALGVLVGLVAAQALAAVLTRRTEILLGARLGWTELHLVAGLVSLMLALALLPALRAIRRPVIDDLRT